LGYAPSIPFRCGKLKEVLNSRGLINERCGVRYRLLVIVLATLLASCTTTTYEFVVPASDAGKLCVTQCAGIREQCRGNEIQRAQSDRAICERSAESSYRACLSTAASNKTDPGKCQRRSCYASEDTYRCDGDYQQCFVNCGGQVIPHTTKY